jgi:hypothetical protein
MRLSEGMKKQCSGKKQRRTTESRRKAGDKISHELTQMTRIKNQGIYLRIREKILIS